MRAMLGPRLVALVQVEGPGRGDVEALGVGLLQQRRRGRHGLAADLESALPPPWNHGRHSPLM